MLTFIQPCGWCSSSVSSAYCPSHVGKSIEPCPDLSTSLFHSSTSSLISNNDTHLSHSIHTFSSDDQTRTTSTRYIRSSVHHPEDYYTNKRIEQLHERMDDIQISNFLLFINHHLALKKSSEHLHIDHFITDLSNGHILIDLIELFSSTKLKREHGRTRFHSLSNIQIVLDYLKLRVQHINITPHDIVSGNRKQILALLWIIMKTFNFPDFYLKKKNCFVENTLLGFGQDRSLIIKWLNRILHHSNILINDFSLQTWNNGYYLSLILKYLIPLSLKYFTMECFDYLKELNSSNKQCLQICFQLSSYCFDTRTLINYTDRTDMCLFKYFTELYENIFIILKSNQLGIFIQNNPYTKEIVQTVIQSTEHSSDVSYDNEQYLVCIEKNKQDIILNSMDQCLYSTDDLSRIRTVEKSRLFNVEQQKIISMKSNRWENAENTPSHSSLINGHDYIVKETINKLPELNGTINSTETSQPLVFIDDCHNVVSTVTHAETEQISPSDIKNTLDHTSEQSIVQSNEEEQINNGTKEIEQSTKTTEEQLKNEIQSYENLQEQYSLISIENDQSKIDTIAEKSEPNTMLNQESEKEKMIILDKKEETVTVVQEIKESTILLDEQQQQQQLFSADENIKPLEEITATTTIDEPVIDVNPTEETKIVLVECKQFNPSLENQFSMTTVDRSKHASNEMTANEQSTKHKQIQKVPGENENLNKVATQIEIVEKSIESQSAELSSNASSTKQEPETKSTIIIENNPISNNAKSENPNVNKSSQNITSNRKTTTTTTTMSSITTVQEVTKPIVMESQYLAASNGYNNKTTSTRNKRPAIHSKKSVPTTSSQLENINSSVSNEQQISSTIIVEPLEHRQITTEYSTIPKPSKYSDIVRKSIPRTTNKSRQDTISLQSAEQSTLLTAKAISSSIMSNENSKPSQVTAGEIERVPLMSTIEESEQEQVSLNKQDQFATSSLEEPLTLTQSPEEETKKSPRKNKRSRRSNAKKGKEKSSSIKEANSLPSPPPASSSSSSQESSMIIAEENLSEFSNTSTNAKSSSINSSALRSRKSKKKKHIGTSSTILVGNSSSTNSKTSHHNLFLAIRESLGDRKFLAFKFVFILICLCFSILILVLSHK